MQKAPYSGPAFERGMVCPHTVGSLFALPDLPLN